jgi:hypothetical protein
MVEQHMSHTHLKRVEKKFCDVPSQFGCKMDCIEFRYQTIFMIDSKAVFKVQIMSPHTTSNSPSSQNTTVTECTSKRQPWLHFLAILSIAFFL